MKLKRIFTLGLGTLFLTSCVSTPTWNLNGKSEQQYRDDEVFCSSIDPVDSQPTFKEKYATPLGPSLADSNKIIKRADTYETCMLHAGYSRAR